MIVVMTESVTLARLASYLATVNRYRASRPELAALGGRAPRRSVERAGQLALCIGAAHVELWGELVLFLSCHLRVRGRGGVN